MEAECHTPLFAIIGYSAAKGALVVSRDTDHNSELDAKDQDTLLLDADGQPQRVPLPSALRFVTAQPNGDLLTMGQGNA